MRTHYSRLEKEGLVTERAPVLMETEDGTIVEVFEWLSDEAIEQAHKNPAVLKMWGEFFGACDIVPLNTLSENGSMFAGFLPFS